MAENLRVNSKTTIAEFKRKHNWLVDNATIKLNVSNIKSLSSEDIESLNCGDIVLKEDASGKHAYLVTFKNSTGICLTYVDASIIETQSYDKIDGDWTYNSEDKTENLLDIVTKTEIANGNLENAKPIYYHGINMYDSTNPVKHTVQFHILNNSDAAIDTLAKVKAWAESISGEVIIGCNGAFFDGNNGGVIHAIIKTAYNTYQIFYVDSTGSHGTSTINLEDYFDTVTDACNKIN